MIRQHLFDKRAPADPMFRWRGGEVSRIEGLTDGVFAFALTLIVVSLDVPKDFEDLIDVFRSFPIFAICFVMLVMVWYHHYMFFRRFGLEDFKTVVLNTILLFVVLFYVYPLKYVFTFLLSGWLGLDVTEVKRIDLDEAKLLMAFYSVGVVLIFGLFAFMYWRASRLREELELDELEIHIANSEIGGHLISAGIGVASIVLVFTAGKLGPPLAGLVYFLMGPAQGIWGWRRGKRADAMHAALLASGDKSDATGA